jgi:glucose-1-phosphate cytidylyltransferase
MKTIILAGGFGTRLSEYTDLVPKPMVPIGPKPILWHLMNVYASYNHKDFFIALGYKSEVIKDYFLNYQILNSDFSVNLLKGDTNIYKKQQLDWNIHLIDTGAKSMTGGRVKRMKDYINNETFMLTYGDGVADINIDELLAFHKSHGKLVTMTAVRPAARFGELDINDGRVTTFKEKPQLDAGWINGGFFVIEPEFFEYIEGDHTMLEREPLEKVASINELMAYKHYGFWQCMDTKRDRDHLNDLWESNKAPWAQT